MNELHLFAGAGGGILAGQLLGHRCVCAVEWEPYAQAVLVARQNDGTFPSFPIWDDVQTFDGKPWRGIVDVVCGGFPCQDISVAGNGAGIEGKRSGMWFHMARIIGEVRPKYVEVENSPMLTSRGLGRVLGDLAEMGYDAEWGVISAADTGAPHLRERIWIVAHSSCERHRNEEHEVRTRWNSAELRSEVLANSASIRQSRQRESINSSGYPQNRKRKAGYAFDVCKLGQWPTEPELGRVADGVAYRTHRLKAIGNGQVPRVAAAAFDLLAK